MFMKDFGLHEYYRNHEYYHFSMVVTRDYLSSGPSDYVWYILFPATFLKEMRKKENDLKNVKEVMKDLEEDGFHQYSSRYWNW